MIEHHFTIDGILCEVSFVSPAKEHEHILNANNIPAIIPSSTHLDQSTLHRTNNLQFSNYNSINGATSKPYLIDSDLNKQSNNCSIVLNSDNINHSATISPAEIFAIK